MPNIRDIRRLIYAEEILLKQSGEIPTLHEYAQLSGACILKERRDEIQKLRALFSGESLDVDFIKTEFKKLCAAREKANQETALSFFASPTGYCNSLYWKIACYLFDTEDLATILSVVLPSITHTLNFDVAIDTSARIPGQVKLRGSVCCELKSVSITELKEQAPSSDVLAFFVSDKEVLLDLRGMAQFPFPIHEEFYKLVEKRPELLRKVYQHNQEFKSLGNNLSVLRNQGRTPREVLIEFQHELHRASDYFGSHGAQKYASPSAYGAFTRFREYLDRLPEDFRTRIENIAGFKAILEHLQPLNWRKIGECIEGGALQIRRILETPANHALLNERPYLKDEELRALRKRRFELNVKGCDETVKLPAALKKYFITQINIEDIDELLNLMLVVPPEEYEEFLMNINISWPQYLTYFETMASLLGPEKINAFFKMVMRHHDKFGGEWAVYAFVGHTLYQLIHEKNSNAIKALFDAVGANVFSNIARHQNTMDETRLMLCRVMANFPDVFEVGLKSFPADSIETMIFQENVDGNTLLHLAPACLPLLVELLGAERVQQWITASRIAEKNSILHLAAANVNALTPLLEFLKKQGIEKFSELFKRRNWTGQTVLHLAAANPTALALLRDCFGLALFNACLKQKDNKGRTPLHCENLNLESGKLMLTHCPELIDEKNENGSNILHYAVSSVDFLKDLYQRLGHEKFLNFIREKNKLGNTPVHITNLYLPSLMFIYEKVGLAVFLELVQIKNNKGNTLVHEAVKNSEVLKFIHCVIGDDAFLEMAHEKNNKGNNLFHLAVSNPELFNFLLLMLKDEQLIPVLNSKNNAGETVFTRVTEYPELLKRILERFTKETCLEFLLQKDENQVRLIERIIQKNPACLAIILLCIPEKDRLRVLMEPVQGVFAFLRVSPFDYIADSKILEHLPPQDRERAFILNNLNSYIRRIEHRQSNSIYGFAFGFWVDATRRAESRKANYFLACALRDALLKGEQEISALFDASQITGLRERLAKEKNLVGYRHKINSEDLKYVLADAQRRVAVNLASCPSIR